MRETITIQGELYELSSYGEKFPDGSRRATVRLAPQADDPVTDLVATNPETTTAPIESAQPTPHKDDSQLDEILDKYGAILNHAFEVDAQAHNEKGVDGATEWRREAQNEAKVKLQALLATAVQETEVHAAIAVAKALIEILAALQANKEES